MKALAFLLIPLVVTMISGTPTKSYADPQIDILLSIATHARDNLGITISQISNVPDEINHLYKQGSNETDELAQADTHQDADSARQHFLAAMKFFKETNDAINSLNATATSDQQKIEMREPQGEIVRLENMGNLLKSIALQNDVDINFTSFYAMLQNATQDINSGNLDDASKQVQNANDFVVATHNSITEAAQKKNTEREKHFTEEQITQLNGNQTTSLNATGNSTNTNSNVNQANVTQNNTPMNLPPKEYTVNNSNNTTVENNPNDVVTKLKQLVSEGKLNQAINLIKIIHAHQREYLTQKHAQVYSTVNNTVPNTPPTPPPAPVNNTVPNTPPPAPVNNTVPNTPPTPPPAPVNNTTSTPSSHHIEVNQTALRHVMEHYEHVRKHHEGIISDKNRHSQN